MWRRRERTPSARRMVGGLAAAALVGMVSLSGANPAAAAPAPDPNYKAGKDVATFTVLGVLDRNCLVSLGGNEIWIKPGDLIDFKSTLAGVDSSKLPLGLLNDLTGKLVGLNVTATIDSGSSKQTVKVAAGKTTTFPSSTQKALAKGDHKITWTANSVSVLGLLPIPLQASALKSGASLSWQGVIHVTPDAPKCKLGVSTPRVDVSLGPIKVTVPQQNVSVPGVTLPNDVPSLPNLSPNLPGKSTTAPSSSAPTSSAPAPGYELSGPSVPEQVVPGGSADSVYTGTPGILASGDGGFAGILPKLGDSLGAKKSSGGASTTGGGNADTAGAAPVSQDKTVELAADPGTPSSQLPVILAILAIIALALVAGTYARLFLLKQKL